MPPPVTRSPGAPDDGVAAERVIAFPPFKPILIERRLERDGVEIEIGGRALERKLSSRSSSALVKSCPNKN